MHVRDHSFTQPLDNLAYDDALLQLAQHQGMGETLRFWESPVYCVVLGRIGDIKQEVNFQAIKNDQVPVLRRSSGGGTVVQGPGCLNYALILSKHQRPYVYDLRSSYEWIGRQVIAALALQGVKAKFFPISDIATQEGLKFSGNAQRRGKDYMLHHGTILYNFDLAMISRYLPMPAQMPSYRNQRSHHDFVTNIPIEPGQFKKDLALQCGFSVQVQPLSPQEVLFLSQYPRSCCVL